MRQCGGCEVCCYIAEVKDVNKSAFQKCKHQCDGCAIFGKSERPQVCVDFECMWLRGYGNENDRPDKNGLLAGLSVVEGLNWIVVKEVQENAAITTGLKMLVELSNTFDFPIMIADYDIRPPHDIGNRVVIHKKIEYKCKALMGEFLQQLDENINLYKLRIDK